MSRSRGLLDPVFTLPLMNFALMAVFGLSLGAMGSPKEVGEAMKVALLGNAGPYAGLMFLILAALVSIKLVESIDVKRGLVYVAWTLVAAFQCAFFVPVMLNTVLVPVK